MIESLYRVSGGAVDFRTLSLQPRPFLGTNGFQLDYEHLDDDELWRRGRAVGAVIDGELYLILLDAAQIALLRRRAARLRSVVASAAARARLADRRDRRASAAACPARAGRARRCSGWSPAPRQEHGLAALGARCRRGRRACGVSGMGGCCCIDQALLSRSNAWSGGWVAGARRGLPNARACYRRRTFKRPRGRGGIGRRAGFRFQYRKMWGFESLRPHQSADAGMHTDFIGT